MWGQQGIIQLHLCTHRCRLCIHRQRADRHITWLATDCPIAVHSTQHTQHMQKEPQPHTHQGCSRRRSSRSRQRERQAICNGQAEAAVQSLLCVSSLSTVAKADLPSGQDSGTYGQTESHMGHELFCNQEQQQKRHRGAGSTRHAPRPYLHPALTRLTTHHRAVHSRRTRTPEQRWHCYWTCGHWAPGKADCSVPVHTPSHTEQQVLEIICFVSCSHTIHCYRPMPRMSRRCL